MEPPIYQNFEEKSLESVQEEVLFSRDFARNSVGVGRGG